MCLFSFVFKKMVSLLLLDSVRLRGRRVYAIVRKTYNQSKGASRHISYLIKMSKTVQRSQTT